MLASRRLYYWVPGLVVLGTLGLVIGLGIGCDQSITASGDGGAGSGGGNGDAHDMGLSVTPDPANLDLNAGGPPVTQTFTATAHLPGGDMDVSNLSAWSIDDPGMGSLPNKTFTSVITRGGTTFVHAMFTPAGSTRVLSGEAVLNVRFHAGVTGGCMGCPGFPPDNAPPCSDPNSKPTIVYPPDGVLLPPNMNVIAVHFMPGTGNDLFEVDFRNNATDVRVETRCNPVTDTRGNATGGCEYKLDQTVWDYVAQSNRGGDPVQVIVRGAPNNVSCAAKSDARNISFAQEDIHGGIYYWQSLVQNGMPAGTTGGIYRHDFGAAQAMSQPFITPGTTNRCVGCHFLSRDGLRMTFGSDDADSDDEYGDLRVNLMNVMTLQIMAQGIPAGFQTFSPDHTKFLSTDGEGRDNPPTMTLYNGDTGAMIGTVQFPGFAGKRAVQPDWTKDGATVYFVVPGAIIPWCAYSQGPGCSNPSHVDDDHFSGGSIYKMPYDPGTGMFGAPAMVVSAANGDENNYYPSVSPDGQFLVFNRAHGTDDKSRDAFNNPGARLWALKINGGLPVDMQRANKGDGLTNSWPRWSPFIQMYRGKRLLWVTFSSTRDYGLRIRNENIPAAQGGPLVNCYPPDSPESVCPVQGVNCHHDPFVANCNQPQIWMAAVSLSDLELAAGDPSFQAFWLPFQEELAHNHIAQWTEVVVGPPPGDGGVCGVQGQPCSASSPCCAGYVCDASGHCQFNIP
ncbi:MAG TPA: hypothetical protein VKN99_20680 [Polyangia bacterium]|nr:hypothetical protein [Polyangia bacterium]